MAGKLTLEQILQRKQQVGAEAKQPTVNQLATATGVASPTSAVGAGLIPGTTSDQAKMMGTPAQRQAKVASLGGETQLEQAAKLRAPAEATAEDEAKKRKAAALSQGLGTFGDKATELVEATLRNITGQQVQAAPTPQPKEGEAPAEPAALNLKLDTAAGRFAGKTGDQLAKISQLVNNIATMPAGADRNAATLQLNAELGLTGETALKSEEVSSLIAKLPETVAGAAATAVTKTVGDKVTLEDLTQVGTNLDELSSLLGIPPEQVSQLTFGELQNQLATIGQQTFGETQAVQAGMASGLLSPTERAALRDVLATMEETGVAGAELQVADIGKDIAAGTTITVGGQQYSIEELLAADEMTDIVKQVLADPKGKLAQQLKVDSPDLFNWIAKSEAGLKTLLTAAETGVKEFKTIQEKNLAVVKPLLAYKDYFSKMKDKDGKPLFDLTALRTGEIKIEDLPPSMQAVLNTPAEKQQVVLTALTQLPADAVAQLDAAEIANLGLDNPNGLWSKYVAESASRKRIASIPNEQPQIIFDTLGWGSVDDANKVLADAILVEAMGGPKHPLLDIDVNDDGKITDADMDNLKKLAAGGELPSLKDIAKRGSVPTVQLPNTKAALDYGSATNQQFAGMAKDGNLSPDETNQLASSPSFSIQELERLANTAISTQNPQLRNGLNDAINAKVRSFVSSGLDSVGIPGDIVNQLSALNIPEPSWMRRDEEWNNINQRMDQARSAITALQQLAQSATNPRVKGEFESIIAGLQTQIGNKQTAIDNFNAEFNKQEYTAKGSRGVGGGAGQALSDLGGTASTGFKRLVGKGRL